MVDRSPGRLGYKLKKRVARVRMHACVCVRTCVREYYVSMGMVQASSSVGDCRVKPNPTKDMHLLRWLSNHEAKR